MKKNSADNIQLTSSDDLFSLDSSAKNSDNQVQEVPLTMLFPFKNHPFQVRDDNAMRELVESIKKKGVLYPGIVRPRQEGGYEILAGHRRKLACELAGIDTMPVYIQDLDDDEATITMVDTNLQREKILPSEKAFAYKMKVEALKHQGERRDRTSAPPVPKLTAREKIARDAGEKSGMSVTRYISLTKLILPLLTLVDEEKLAVSTAADYLSDLPENEQTDLVKVMDRLHIIPGRGQLAKIRKHSKEGTLTVALIEEILSSERPVSVQVVLKKDRLKRYFPSSYTAKQMEEVIVNLLEQWSAKQHEN